MDGILKEFEFVIRSMNYYANRIASKRQADDYNVEKFNKWVNNHRDIYNEITTVLADFNFDSLVKYTIVYFKTKEANKDFSLADKFFLNTSIFQLKLFEDCDALSAIWENNFVDSDESSEEDEKDDAEKIAQLNQSIVDSMKQLSTNSGKRLLLEKLSGSEGEDIEEWFEDYERLAGAEGWSNDLLGLKLPSYLKDTALLTWKNMKETERCSYEAIKKANYDVVGCDRYP
jgi:hypothetical protein